MSAAGLYSLLRHVKQQIGPITHVGHQHVDRLTVDSGHKLALNQDGGRVIPEKACQEQGSRASFIFRIEPT